MAELIFATSNRAKLAQMAFVIKHLKSPLTLISAVDQFGEQASYEEVGSSAAVIAQQGALALASIFEHEIVVEDTAFHVTALSDGPGVRAGEYLKTAGRQGILAELEGERNRKAAIVSAVAWASPRGEMQSWITAVEGRIANRETWTRGMPEWVAPSDDNPLGGGFNAIFVPNGKNQTLAQIAPEDAIFDGYREPNFCALVSFLHGRNS